MLVVGYNSEQDPQCKIRYICILCKLLLTWYTDGVLDLVNSQIIITVVCGRGLGKDRMIDRSIVEMCVWMLEWLTHSFVQSDHKYH